MRCRGGRCSRLDGSCAPSQVLTGWDASPILALVRRPLKRALAVTALLAIASPAAFGCAVAFHLASDEHHGGGSAHEDSAAGLRVVLHGHSHGPGTPSHGHPFLTNAAVPIPTMQLLLVGAMVGDAPLVVVPVTSGWRPPTLRGPTHDPPPRIESFSVLRI